MVKSTLNKLERRLRRLTPDARRQLAPLIDELRQEIEDLSRSSSDSANSILGFADVSTHEATRDHRDASLLKHAVSGLEASVQGLETSHPKLVQVVNRICDALSGIGV